MRKKYKFSIDCANCAAKVEREVAKLDGVESCTVSFMTEKMIVEYADNVNIEEKFNEIKKIAHKVDSDSEIN